MTDKTDLRKYQAKNVQYPKYCGNDGPGN